MRALRIWVLQFGITLVLALAPLAHAQRAVPLQTATGPGVTTLTVSSRLTLVDVTVTDSKGHPVHGLAESEFTIKEDGKPQPIKNFDEFGLEKLPTEAAPPQLPPNVYTNGRASPPTTRAVNILLFDQVATGISRGLQRPNAEALKYAKEASLQYLKTLRVGTKVAVMAMDRSGLHMVQGFTSDRDLLVAAVNSTIYQLAPESYWDPPIPHERPNWFLLCDAMNFQSAQALNALNQVALFVSGMPGRKNLMWFTPGTAWLTNYPPLSVAPPISGCLTDYTAQLQQVYGRLTSARVAVYPIDPRGLYGDPTVDATVDTTAKGPPPPANPIGFSNLVNADRDSLEDVAKATGGKAYSAGNDLAGALEEDIATGADYYALSYVPPLSKYDGKYHTIEVKVDRPGLQLEYRRGYTSLDINGPLHETENNHSKPAPSKSAFQTAMGYGGPPSTQLTFAVRAVPSTETQKPGDTPVIGSLNPELKGKPLVRYSFAFDLPRDKITLTEQPDGSRKGSFELAIAAYDVQGRVLNSLDEKRSFVLKPEVAGFLHRPFVVPVEIDLPPGKDYVRAGAFDVPSQEMGVVDIPLTVKVP